MLTIVCVSPDSNGQQLGFGGGELIKLKQIDLSQRDPRLNWVQVDVACNWYNLLWGERGVPRVFAPQKEASVGKVEEMALALEHYAKVIKEDLGLEVRELSGSGASGGLGTGLLALIGANLHPRYEIVMQYLELDRLLTQVDLVITAEGCLDYQTPKGKIPAEVARRAKYYNLPVIALAGTIGQDAEINWQHGIDYFASILTHPCHLQEAIANTANLLTNAAEGVARMLIVGRQVRHCTFSGW